MRHTQVRAQTTRASVHKTRATTGMTLAEARTLVNWLSTRTETVAGGDGVLVVAPDHAYERALVASRLAKVRQLGLTVVPGTYLPPGVEKRPAPQHLVRCRSCEIEYSSAHLHCCQCGRVMRTARGFEAHASGTAGRCAGDEQSARRGLRVVDGVWRRTAPTSLSAATSRAS